MEPTVSQPDQSGHFGPYGGRYVAEILMPAVLELEQAYHRIVPEAAFQSEFQNLLQQYVGRPKNSNACSALLSKAVFASSFTNSGSTLNIFPNSRATS